MFRQTDRQTDRETDRQTERQTDRQTDRQVVITERRCGRGVFRQTERQAGRYYGKAVRKRCVLSSSLQDDKDEERRTFSGSEFQTTGAW